MTSSHACVSVWPNCCDQTVKASPSVLFAGGRPGLALGHVHRAGVVVAAAGVQGSREQPHHDREREPRRTRTETELDRPPPHEVSGQRGKQGHPDEPRGQSDHHGRQGPEPLGLLGVVDESATRPGGGRPRPGPQLQDGAQLALHANPDEEPVGEPGEQDRAASRQDQGHAERDFVGVLGVALRHHQREGGPDHGQAGSQGHRSHEQRGPEPGRMGCQPLRLRPLHGGGSLLTGLRQGHDLPSQPPEEQCRDEHGRCDDDRCQPDRREVPGLLRACRWSTTPGPLRPRRHLPRGRRHGASRRPCRRRRSRRRAAADAPRRTAAGGTARGHPPTTTRGRVARPGSGRSGRGRRRASGRGRSRHGSASSTSSTDDQDDAPGRGAQDAHLLLAEHPLHAAATLPGQCALRRRPVVATDDQEQVRRQQQPLEIREHMDPHRLVLRDVELAAEPPEAAGHGPARVAGLEEVRQRVEDGWCDHQREPRGPVGVTPAHRRQGAVEDTPQDDREQQVEGEVPAHERAGQPVGRPHALVARRGHEVVDVPELQVPTGEHRGPVGVRRALDAQQEGADLAEDHQTHHGQSAQPDGEDGERLPVAVPGQSAEPLEAALDARHEPIAHCLTSSLPTQGEC